MVREWLLKNNYDQIWFKPHTKRNDLVFCQGRTYLATDLWNLFDGMCFDYSGALCFLQMKTNAWADEKRFKEFRRRYQIDKILSFNVSNKLKSSNGKYKVHVRIL